MKTLTPKQMLAVFRDVVEESARAHGRKKIGKAKAAAKPKRVAKQTRKPRAAAE